MRRRYQKVQELLPEIKRMLESGMSQREVAERLGLEGDRPIHDLLKRERKKAKQVLPKQRGRKPARTLKEYKYENQRLKMENELLRDFITLMGRKGGQSSSIKSFTVIRVHIRYPSCAQSLAAIMIM